MNPRTGQALGLIGAAVSGTVASVGIGLILTDVGAGVCLLAAIAAFASRRPPSRMMPPPAYATYGGAVAPLMPGAPAPPAVTYSPDGRYWWNGQQWVPVAPPASPTYQ